MILHLGMRAITSAVNHAWGVEKQPSYFRHKLMALLMLIAASVLLLGGLMLVSAINVIEARWFAVVLARTPALLILQNIAVKIARPCGCASNIASSVSTSTRRAETAKSNCEAEERRRASASSGYW